jgi:beta-lactamase regulating signal transducer with metallopeptidase domain
MLCILYVTAFGTLLGVVGLIIERVLPATFPRRLLWCAIIPSSIIIPGMYRYHHTFSVNDVLNQSAAGFWAQTESFDTTINRVWLLVSGMLLMWGLINVWRVSRVISQSRRRSVVDGVPVVVTDSIGPATVGLLRSSVLLPKWVLVLPGMQRQYVVRHEEEHRRTHDARLLLVASLALLLMPWNLAMWWLLRRLSLAIEMDCDNRVVSALGDANAYGELLLKVAQAGSRGPRLQPAFLGGVGTLERRLTMLLAPTPLRHAQKILLPIAACVLLFIVLSIPHPIVGHGSHAHVTMTSQR